MESTHTKITDYFQRKEAINTFEDNELILFHCFTHQAANQKRIKKVKEVHDKVVAEMKKRNLNHTVHAEIDEEVEQNE